MAASFGTFGRIWSATARLWTLATTGVSCARAVAMKAETARRGAPLLEDGLPIPPPLTRARTVDA